VGAEPGAAVGGQPGVRLAVAGGAALCAAARCGRGGLRGRARTAAASTQSDTQGPIVFLTSAAIGISTGFGVLVFEGAIGFLEEAREEIPFSPFAPVFGAIFLVGLIAVFGKDGLKGTDIKSLKSYATPGGPSPPENWPLRAAGNSLAAAVTLGSGNSLGPEAPAAVLGANVAFGVSQALSLFGTAEPTKEEASAKLEEGRKPGREQKALIEKALAGSQVVAALEAGEVERLLDSFQEVTLSAGERLMKQGDRVGDDEPGLYVTESGELDVYVTQEGGEGLGEKVFTYKEDGQLIGELAVLFSAPRAATVVAQTDCTLWTVDRDSFLAAGGRSQGSARRLSMNPDSVLASGAAAGVAAGFNAPIAGIFFASEVVRPTGENSLDLTTRLLAAALSAAVVRTFASGGPGLGDVSSLQFAWLGGNVELLAFIGLGIAIGCVSYGFGRAQQAARGTVAMLTESGVPSNIMPIVGSIFMVLISSACSGRVLFDGFKAINEVLADTVLPLDPSASQWSLGPLLGARGLESQVGLLSAASLLLLVFLKLSATVISQASGLVGGVFAPSLFMGACLGGAFGRALGASLGAAAIVSSPSTYLVVGAASMLAANCSVPITSVVLAVEIAGGASYEATLPLICGIAVATYVSSVLLPRLLEGISRDEALRRLDAGKPADDLGV